MESRNNPQAEQMAHESMVRNLAAQAEAIWPQESAFFSRYTLPRAPSILDLGCGTGEISFRLAQRFAAATVLGVDLDANHLSRARERSAQFGARVRFEVGDALELVLPDHAFDLTVCRHLSQAVPNPRRLLEQMVRVTRPGGWLHMVAEDYGMIHFHPTTTDTDRFWREGPIVFGASSGCDLLIGRKVFTMMSQLGLQEVRVDYVTIDTLRVPREVFARIWEAWRDGYAEGIAANSKLSFGEVTENFNTMLACLRDPHGYAVWHLPVISGRRP